MLPIDERGAGADHGPRQRQRDQARRRSSAALRTLRMDGVEKVLNGVTTLDEVLRVTQQD